VIRRPATLADVDAIVAMGARFLAQSVYRGHLADNPAQVRALAQQLIDAPHGDVLVVDADGTLVGMLALLAYAHHLSGEWVAGEVAFWIDPAYRGLGLRLLRDAERWARAHGAARLELIAPTPDVETLYTRLGYAPIERTYQREMTVC
jgi:GNAT superfamily N-acetyltransferase